MQIIFVLNQKKGAGSFHANRRNPQRHRERTRSRCREGEGLAGSERRRARQAIEGENGGAKFGAPNKAMIHAVYRHFKVSFEEEFKAGFVLLLVNADGYFHGSGSTKFDDMKACLHGLARLGPLRLLR